MTLTLILIAGICFVLVFNAGASIVSDDE